MESVDRFLKEDWDDVYDTESLSEFKHLHEFGLRYFEMNSTCEGDHAKSISILKSMDYEEEEINEIIEWFREEGGHCDCEVYLNVVMPRVVVSTNN